MAFFRGPNIVTEGLIYSIDPASTRSYPGTGTTVFPVIPELNNNNGTINGSTTYTAGAQGGFNFNGPTTFDNITVTETETHQTGQDFSYEGWFYFDALSGFDKTIVGKVGCNIGLVQAGSSMRMQVFGPGGPCASGNFPGIASASITLSTWQHWIGTYEVGVGVKLYRDGIFISSTGYTGNIGNYGTLFVGGSINTSYTMDGRIAVARVYKKTLSSSEALQNFNSQKSRFGLA